MCIPPHLPPFLRIHQRNLLPSETSAAEAGSVPGGARAREESPLAFVSVTEMSLTTSILLGSSEFYETHCLGLGYGTPGLQLGIPGVRCWANVQ